MKNALQIIDEDLNEEDFLFFKEKIFDLAGIYLTDKKKDLVKSRIRSYNHKNNISSFSEYRQLLEAAKPSSEAVQTFINLLTTNKTDFFREQKHFDYLVNHIIELWKKNNKSEVKIWCCASSTGEEPYTLAMVLDHYLPKGISFKIFASDIDTKVLDRAQNGVYPISKLSEIPEKFHSKYITLGEGNAAGWFRIKDSLHKRIVFKQHNLIENTYPGDKIFDLISCRNVLIYFSSDTIKILVQKLYKALKDDGYLFIGHSESIPGTGHLFKSLRPSIFIKADS